MWRDHGGYQPVDDGRGPVRPPQGGSGTAPMMVQGWQARAEQAEAALAKLAEAGTGYSQETMDAMVAERTTLQAEVKRFWDGGLAGHAFAEVKAALKGYQREDESAHEAVERLRQESRAAEARGLERARDAAEQAIRSYRCATIKSEDEDALELEDVFSQVPNGTIAQGKMEVDALVDAVDGAIDNAAAKLKEGKP